MKCETIEFATACDGNFITQCESGYQVELLDKLSCEIIASNKGGCDTGCIIGTSVAAIVVLVVIVVVVVVLMKKKK